jgi:kumamolisin
MFGADVQIYDDGAQRFRARTGVLRIPREIAPWTRAVVGFDQRPLLLAVPAMRRTGCGRHRSRRSTVSRSIAT